MTEKFDDFVYQVWKPGLHPKYFEAMVDAGLKALIIEGYHSGTLPAATPEEGGYTLVPFLAYARERKVPVFLTFRPHVGDLDNRYGYQPFDEGKVRGSGYQSTVRVLAAGIIPLKASWGQVEQVCQRMREVLNTTSDYQSIIRLMHEAFPFNTSLEQIQSTS